MKIKPIYIFLFLIILLNLLLLFNIFNKQNNINSYFRLHITANSNTTLDQTIKEKVAKNINSYIESLNITSLDKNQTKKIIKNNIYNLLDIANNTLKENNINYSANIKYGNMYYTKRESTYLNMPSGIYDSINITLGKGEGKNFWSLLYPNDIFTKKEEISSTNQINIYYESFFLNIAKKWLNI